MEGEINNTCFERLLSSAHVEHIHGFANVQQGIRIILLRELRPLQLPLGREREREKGDRWRKIKCILDGLGRPLFGTEVRRWEWGDSRVSACVKTVLPIPGLI